MEMQIKAPLDKKNRPILITGPCSAETEAQVMATAEQLANLNIEVDLFRAGIWKPRTRPNNFEGIGFEGLHWLRKVKDTYGFRVTTEVANTQHVFEALKIGIDVLWLGARTTVNPFSVQEIADALKGVDIPVFIKNPINPDLKLWMGAVERIYKAGIDRIGLVHRGFSQYGHTIYRNAPQWQIPIELKRIFPDIMMICDASHICGSRDHLFEVSQTALDLNYDGVMLESHIDPDNAWSDAKQQVTPFQLKEMILSRLTARSTGQDDPNFLSNIEDLRARIDVIDKELIQQLANRMQIAEMIGQYKKQNNIAILQPSRWNEIFTKAMEQAGPLGLSEEFVSKMLKAIHQESIYHQEKIMRAESNQQVE
ncbi:MAG: bifunctional 3-deoxy-7-phosphoheptulonate synthase/chorismate mutase type II [Saprospiraceae bacterium]|jgi:chorismate mutase|nr:bifunctional 3-deoxy-7-phosphoheptulonate synthase/chorismate mutase type II [Saprospiraceae bacterium]